MNPGNWVWIAAPLIWIGLILVVRGPKGLRDDELSKEGRIVGGLRYAQYWSDVMIPIFDGLFGRLGKRPRHTRKLRQ